MLSLAEQEVRLMASQYILSSGIVPFQRQWLFMQLYVTYELEPMTDNYCNYVHISGGFRNLERGVQPLAREVRPQIIWVHAHFRSHWKSELNISKQL